MPGSARKRRDMLQNIAIALLSVTAVVLFTQTQLTFLGAGSGYFSQLSGSDAGEGVLSPGEEAAVPASPVRVAVTGSYGRYGSLCLTTADETFAPLGRRLDEALGSARTFTPCTADDFLGALSHTSLYYDFLEPLPLSLLVGPAGAAGVDGKLSARRLVIAAEGASVRLYLWDGGAGYLTSATAVTPENLEETADGYELGSAVFAMDRPGTAFDALEPCSLLPSELPEIPVLSAAVIPAGGDRTLPALHFNPHTKSRYVDSGGTEVIMEGERSLYLRPDGTVFYKSGGSDAVTVPAGGDGLSLQQAAQGASALLNAMLGNAAGDAALYLQSVRQSGDTTTFQFGYQSGGVPIRFSDGGHAAQVTLNGAVVSSLSLRFRQYTAAGENTLLLPLTQALAIAGDHPGAELSIGYADQGGGAVRAAWLLD